MAFNVALMVSHCRKLKIMRQHYYVYVNTLVVTRLDEKRTVQSTAG